jgi:hypothetical protein
MALTIPTGFVVDDAIFLMRLLKSEALMSKPETLRKVSYPAPDPCASEMTLIERVSPL